MSGAGLTRTSWSHTLGAVRRLTAILLGVALASAVGPVTALHTHTYTDHDHPEHHHGLATHVHHAVEAHSDDDAVSLESCDPGRHAVSIVVGCAALAHQLPVAAECVTPAVVQPLVRLHTTTALADLRVHGPPPRTHSSPRAPPLHYPAMIT